MTQPILHSRTEAALQNYLQQPTHGLILAGPKGIGKLHLALWLAERLATNVMVIQSAEDKKVITIEHVRELYNITRTGSPLIIIIKNAQELGREAQNAFLKLLEEPPKNTRFILTTESTTQLLSTIRSRSQVVEVLPPNKNDVLLLSQNSKIVTEAEAAKYLHTSKGLPGKFTKIISNKSTHDFHNDMVQLAKKFYGAAPYERHILCVEYKYEKDWAHELLDVLAVIIQTLLTQAGTKQITTDKLTEQAMLIETTSVNLFRINGNPKIHLAKLSEQL